MFTVGTKESSDVTIFVSQGKNETPDWTTRTRRFKKGDGREGVRPPSRRSQCPRKRSR